MLKRFPNISMRWIGLLFCLVLTLALTVDFVVEWAVPKDNPLWMLIQALVRQAYIVTGSFPFVLSVFLVLSLIFTAGYWWSTADEDALRHPRQMIAYFLLQALIVLVCKSLLIFVLLVQLALLRPRRLAFTYLIVFLLLQLMTSGLIIWQSDYSGQHVRMHIDYLRSLGLIVVLGVIFGLAYTTKEEYLARKALMATHAHLQATQILLQKSARDNERSRLARDVHDNLGHHLTALNLHLDLAQRQARLDQSNELKTALTTARALAQSVLLEVRTVVSGERHRQDSEMIDLPAALHALCAGIPAPHIELHVQVPLRIHSFQLAHHLFCCIQEAITNTVRHAHARHLKIDVSSDKCGLSVTFLDDGCGWCEPEAAEGNGLTGMRERVRQLGGQLYINHLTERLSMAGFSLEIVVPHGEGGSFE